MARIRGFSLVELVMVMVIITVGLLGMSGLFANSSKALTTNSEMQKVAQYAQECGEKIIALRRISGYAAVTTTACGTSPTGFTWTVGTPTSDTSTRCPSGTTCEDVVITVTSTTLPAVLSAVTIMLVNY
jgi:prepilin-type N-terminal cleavage/methylation domain-containing protein